MCKCSPEFRLIYQIDEESKKRFKAKLPKLMSYRGKIKQEQEKEEILWWKLAKNKKADTIFFNGTIYTMEDSQSIVYAVAILNGRILAVGFEVEIFKFKDENTKMIDLNRRTMLPGFIDPHIHMCFSSMVNYVDLSPFQNYDMEQVFKTIVKKVQITKYGEWAQFQLFDPMITPGTLDVSRQALDKISETKAIFIYEANGHVAHVNSLAFKLAGITKDTPDPPHGRFIRTSSGELTGEVQYSAINLFITKMPLATGYDYIAGFYKFLSYASSKGCTSLHDCGIGLISPEADICVLHYIFKDPSPIRYSGYLISTEWYTWQKMNMQPEWKDHQLRVNGVKCWVDGSLQAGSGFLREGYERGEWGRGQPNYTQDVLNKALELAHKKGFQVGVHANGDAGIDMALNAFEYATKKHKKPFLRHRIEHSTVCHPYHMYRMKQLDISPSFLIGHIYYYGAAFKQKILGESRSNLVDPMKSCLYTGLVPTIHSDYNCQPIDPLRCITNAVTRVMRETGTVLNYNYCVSVYEAMKAMTINAAWQCHMDDIVGSMKKGKFADFVILEEDPTKVEPIKIKDIKIWQTWKGGEKWFQG